MDYNYDGKEFTQNMNISFFLLFPFLFLRLFVTRSWRLKLPVFEATTLRREQTSFSCCQTLKASTKQKVYNCCSALQIHACGAIVLLDVMFGKFTMLLQAGLRVGTAYYGWETSWSGAAEAIMGRVQSCSEIWAFLFIAENCIFLSSEWKTAIPILRPLGPFLSLLDGIQSWEKLASRAPRKAGTRTQWTWHAAHVSSTPWILLVSE